jgi:ribosomal protein S18 acetylase RimI-like enzyme
MIDVLDQAQALEAAPELAAVYRSAFGAPGYDEDAAEAERFATEQLPLHAERDGFKLVVARLPRPSGTTAAGPSVGSLDVAGVMGGSGPIVGFAYGYTGHRGQWWSDRVAETAPAEIVAGWVGGHFEVVEMAVTGEAQRQGIGSALHDVLMADLPQAKALLTTYVDDRPAPRLYRRKGWQVLVPDLGWDSALYGLSLTIR